MTTIHDVAKLAGVSKGTVSSVFSKKRPISKEVTERVLAISKELGYYPNHVARSLAIKKTMIIGLRMPLGKDSSMSGFEIQMISGVVKECSKQGYRVLIDSLPELDDVTQFSMDPVDGVILLNPRKHDSRIARYKQTSTPLVLVGRPDPVHEEISYVDNNNKELAYEVGQYLLESGHTSILFLNAASDMTVAQDRRSGLAEAFQHKGISLPPESVLHYSRQLHTNASDYGYESIIHTYGKLPYTAVITDTDRVALGVLRAARELGLVIPDKLAVIAFSNDATLAQETTPSLTSVELSAEILGAEAAKILLEIMQDSTIVHQRIVDAKLVFRESC